MVGDEWLAYLKLEGSTPKSPLVGFEYVTESESFQSPALKITPSSSFDWSAPVQRPSVSFPKRDGWLAALTQPVHGASQTSAGTSERGLSVCQQVLADPEPSSHRCFVDRVLRLMLGVVGAWWAVLGPASGRSRGPRPRGRRWGARTSGIHTRLTGLDAATADDD